MAGWFELATRPDIVRRGLKVGLIVGTLLTLINYGDILLSGQILPTMWWKIPLTYCVPYCVSTYAGVSAIREHGG